VGTRVGPPAGCCAHAVHPHARGDKVTCLSRFKVDIGSPPRAWGQVLDDFERGRESRFTPTRVGTRVGPPAGCCAHAVHPHARGDKGGDRVVHRGGVGSPPRAWGQAMLLARSSN